MRLISFNEALAIVADAARPLGTEAVFLNQARGRTLAAPVTAMVDAPPADVSAMDGYAVREADVTAPATLRVAGASYPGTAFNGALQPGECVRIFTGAAVPAGADRVVIQEVVRREGELAVIDEQPGQARHIRRRGSDFHVGDVLLPAGTVLQPRALVAAAAADVGELSVWRQPRVAVLATGDELAAPGAARETPGSIPESGSFGVAALAEGWGAELVQQRRVRDHPNTMLTAVRQAADTADLVVVIGGASVGDKDLAKPTVAALGFELLFSKVGIKPGKPVWLARRGADGVMALGLPGNPTSAMVTARLLLAPLLAGMCGREAASALHWRRAPLHAALEPCGDRETFVRAFWLENEVQPGSNQDSGAQAALVQAGLLIRRRAQDPAAGPGTTVDIIDF